MIYLEWISNLIIYTINAQIPFTCLTETDGLTAYLVSSVGTNKLVYKNVL